MRMKIGFFILLIFALSVPVHSQENVIVLTMEESIEQALRNNLDLQITRLQLEGTELGLRKAGAAFNPQVNLSLSPLQWEGDETLLEYEPQAHLNTSLLTRGGTSYNFSISGQKGEDDNMKTSWSVGISQQIIPHPQLDSSYQSLEKSRITLEVEKLGFEEKVNELKLEVMRGFYAILTREKECELKRLSFRHAKENFSIATNKLQEGMASELDILDAEAKLISTEEVLFQAESSLLEDRMDFKDLLGIPSQKDIIVVAQSSLNFQPAGMTSEETQREALENHPQIKEQNYQIKLYGLDLATVKSEASPSLSASLAYTSDQPGLEEEYRTSLTLEVPLVDGGEGDTEVRIAEGKLREAELNLEKLKRDIMAEVRQYFLDLKRMEKSLEFLKLSQEKYRQTLEVTKKMFAKGALTGQELQEKEISFKQAEIDLLSALADYEVAKNKLLKSIGRRL